MSFLHSIKSNTLLQSKGLVLFQYLGVFLVNGMGKITSFIGPNGAGKSTVLSIMSRLLNADSGEIYLNGELLNRKKSSDIAKQLAILKAN